MPRLFKLFSVCFVAVTLTILSGCNARDRYIGSYDTNYVDYCWGASGPCNNSSSFETIVVRPGSSENRVILLGQDIAIDDDGKGSYGNANTYGFEVIFKNDIIQLTEHWGGNMGGITRTYTGGKN